MNRPAGCHTPLSKFLQGILPLWTNFCRVSYPSKQTSAGYQTLVNYSKSNISVNSKLTYKKIRVLLGVHMRLIYKRIIRGPKYLANISLRYTKLSHIFSPSILVPGDCAIWFVHYIPSFINSFINYTFLLFSNHHHGVPLLFFYLYGSATLYWHFNRALKL